MNVFFSVYINSSMFRKHHQTSVKPTRPASEESTVHPLPNLFRLLGLTPFKKVFCNVSLLSNCFHSVLLFPCCHYVSSSICFKSLLVGHVLLLESSLILVDLIHDPEPRWALLNLR